MLVLYIACVTAPTTRKDMVRKQYKHIFSINPLDAYVAGKETSVVKRAEDSQRG